MVGKFLESLLTSLIGFGLVYPFVMRAKYGQWKPVTATLIEVLTFAVGAASSEIAFGLYPQLHEGWRELTTRILLIWLIFLPGCYVASRIRSRRSHAV